VTLNITGSVSRPSGWAPHAVFFDAVGTTSTLTDKPFRDLTCVWEVHDGTGVYYRRGMCQSHVFTSPGTGAVVLTVVDTDGTVSRYPTTFYITVQDQDEAFPGEQTVAFANNGVFTDAPDGSRHVTTSSFADVVSYISGNTRALLKRGDVYTQGNVINIYKDDWVLGAYGSGINQDPVYGFYENDPILAASGITAGGDPLVRVGGTNIIVEYLRCEDHTNGGTKAGGYFGDPALDVASTGLLYYRVNAIANSDMDGVPLGYGDDAPKYWEIPPAKDLFYEDCRAVSGNQIEMYIAGEQLSIRNCYAGHSNTSHALRVTYCWKGVLENNCLVEPEYTRHCLKFHSTHDWPTGFHQWTEYTTVVGNYFSGDAQWLVAISPQNGSVEEYLRNIWFDSNTIIAAGPGGHINYGVETQLVDSALRNNVFIVHGEGAWSTAFCDSEQRASVAALPSGLAVENNSIWCNTTNSNAPHDFVLLDINDHSGAIIFNNNICYGTGITTLTSYQGGSVSGSNNITSNPSYTDPYNDDLTLDTGSAAIDAGTPSTAAYLDFDFKVRSATPDIGAYESNGTEWGAGESAQCYDEYFISSSISLAYCFEQYTIAAGTVTDQYSSWCADKYNLSPQDTGPSARWYFSEHCSGEHRSLGGARSGNWLSGNDIDLFSSPAQEDNYSGFTRYRCMYVYANKVGLDTRLWFSYPSALTTMYFAIEAPDAQTIATETSAPTGLAWKAASYYTAYADGYDLGTMQAGDSYAVWIKLVSEAVLEEQLTLSFGFGGYFTGEASGGSSGSAPPSTDWSVEASP